MKAIRIHEYGERNVLKLEDYQVPTISDNEILIKVIAAGINPVDWKIRRGYLQEMIPHKFPLVLEWDVAGIIERCRDKVTEFSIGDLVYSILDIARHGSYAEYIAIKASEVALKPKTISFAEAASEDLAKKAGAKGEFVFIQPSAVY
ncbi:MAG: alcohol dehydrogenase catalytic domain-containing protein [Spirochaetota bacterium]